MFDRLFRLLAGSDRRRAARFRVAHGASLVAAGGARHAARVLDVSQSGVRLVSPAPLEVDASAELHLHFQGEALPRVARVVRCAPEPYGGWEMALRFLPGGNVPDDVVRRYFEFARWLSGHLNYAGV